MKLRNNYCFLLICILAGSSCTGQTDSLIKLRITEFLQLVKQNHPLAKQAELITESADASLLFARGSFDPKLFYEARGKEYDSKNYYGLRNGGFVIPTWFGVEFKGGYEQNRGDFLNPENNLPTQGLLYTQISLPLLQGLIIDERRATLKQAKLFTELSEFEKINAYNELLYRAGKTYWDWHLSFAVLQIQQNAVAISQTRFDAVRITSLLGDRPAIDTVEADIQLQDRILNLQQARMDYRTKSLLLSNYLWIENDTPIELTDLTIPDLAIENSEDETIINFNISKFDSLINVHPSLKIYDFKLQQLDVERRYKQDKLKPNLNVNYAPLIRGDELNLGFQNNYKWGILVGFPIFLRKERGDLKLTKIKIESVNFETVNKRNELMNKTKASINELSNTKNQIEIYEKNILNYERLWESEKRLFDLGESSLFMINAREMSYFNALVKFNEIFNKSKKAALETQYSFGLLNSVY